MRKTNKSMAIVLAVILMISMVFDFGTIYADGGGGGGTYGLELTA